MNTNTTTAAGNAPEEARQRALHQHRRHGHPRCAVCSPDNPRSLHLQCRDAGPGRVAADFKPQPWMAGYDDRMHGGIVAALLDGAMTQCLFAQQMSGATAVLHLRFRRPVPLDRTLRVTACLERPHPRRPRLRAQLRDGERIFAEAQATFVARV